MASHFRDFPTYRDAVDLARVLHPQIIKWSKFDLWSVGMQLVRAVDSVAANIAEASGRWQPLDKKRLLTIARGSLCETEHWLATGRDRGLLPSTYEQETARIASGLKGLIDAQSRRLLAPSS